jgi:hypothetical protein
LVALQWGTGLALAMQAHEDGDASEKRLVPGVLTQTEALVSQPRLFVADRAFCDLVQAARFTERPGDHFLVRYHAGTSFTRDESQPERRGTDSQGRSYVETWGWLGSTANKGRRYVRMIHLTRPGEEDLILITDLLDATAYPATDLLWLYQERWGIERLFQKVTEVFGLERLIGSTPPACIFQFGFCMLLYNIIQLLTTHIARGHQCEVEVVSKEKLFDDVQRELIACAVIFTPEQIMQRFAAALTASQLQARLGEIGTQCWCNTWWKSPPQKRRRPAPRKGKRGHASVYRLLHPQAGHPPKPKRGSKRC